MQSHYNKNYDTFDNDRFNIAGLELYGLEKYIKEFNEENINLLVKNISYILTIKEIERQHLDELVDEIEDLLKEDIFFFSKDGKIYFEKTLVAFHRENENLIYDLTKYVKYFLETSTSPDYIEFKKYIEKKLDINTKYLSKKKSIEKNINNLLKILASMYKGNRIKYKCFLVPCLTVGLSDGK
jgi:hypothetical protein